MKILLFCFVLTDAFLCFPLISLIIMVTFFQKKSSFLKSNFLKFFPLVFSTGLVFCSFSSFNPALAEVDLDAEIQKITDVSASLENVVTGFTTILVGTGGITAAFQVFRRVLLQNV